VEFSRFGIEKLAQRSRFEDAAAAQCDDGFAAGRCLHRRDAEVLFSGQEERA